MTSSSPVLQFAIERNKNWHWSEKEQARYARLSSISLESPPSLELAKNCWELMNWRLV